MLFAQLFLSISWSSHSNPLCVIAEAARDDAHNVRRSSRTRKLPQQYMPPDSPPPPPRATSKLRQSKARGDASTSGSLESSPPAPATRGRPIINSKSGDARKRAQDRDAQRRHRARERVITEHIFISCDAHSKLDGGVLCTVCSLPTEIHLGLFICVCTGGRGGEGGHAERAADLDRTAADQQREFGA